MFYFEGHCPHCDSDKGFQAFGMSEHAHESVFFDFNKDKLHHDPNTLLIATQKGYDVTFTMAGICTSCKMPVVAMCESTEKVRLEIKECIFANKLTNKQLNIIKVFPEKIPLYAHPSLSECVRDAFIDLQTMLRQNMQPHLVISGCRTVLEAAVRELGATGKNLKQHIDCLRDQGKITAVLHAWASHVRLSGNNAVHEMEGSTEEARELVEFTKIFLQFTFELPARIQAVRPTTP